MLDAKGETEDNSNEACDADSSCKANHDGDDMEACSIIGIKECDDNHGWFVIKYEDSCNQDGNHNRMSSHSKRNNHTAFLISDTNTIMHSEEFACYARNSIDYFARCLFTKHRELAREDDSTSALSCVKIELCSLCDDTCVDEINDINDIVISSGSNVVTAPGFISLVWLGVENFPWAKCVLCQVDSIAGEDVNSSGFGSFIIELVENNNVTK